MKTNYKVTDIVTISKPGLFNGFSGEVLSNNPNIKNALSVLVNLSDSKILWSFAYADIEQDKKVAPQGLKSSETAQQINTVEQPAKKRAYQKRDKAKTEVKVTKRKYTKKAKA